MLKDSPDPEAASIAEQEFLELIGVVPNAYDHLTRTEPSPLAKSASNTTNVSALTNVNHVPLPLVAPS